jgi:hypothetical protein
LENGKMRFSKNYILLFLIGGLTIVMMESCTPGTYTFYPSTSHIARPYHLNDTVYLIPPVSTFSILGKDDRIIGSNSKRAAAISTMANRMLGKGLCTQYHCKPLGNKSMDEKLVRTEMEKMVNYFYEHKAKRYKLPLHADKPGYGLILYVNYQLRDSHWWSELPNKSKGVAEPRALISFNLCLFELKSGSVEFYKYRFISEVYGWDTHNDCTDEILFEKKIREGTQKVLRKFAKVSNK